MVKHQPLLLLLSLRTLHAFFIFPGSSSSFGDERRRLVVTAVGTTVGVTALSSRKVRRSVRFEAGLALILSRYVSWWAFESRGIERHESLERVHEETAEKTEQLVRSMMGAYVKSAQIVSSAFPETLPAAWVRRLETLVDDAPPRPWVETKKVLEKELDGGIEKFFSKFDEVPVAAASVGQVHRAELLSGEEVAVKIQYPGVESLIVDDLANVRRVVSILKPALLPAIDEFRLRVSGEFDYVKEGERANMVKAFFENRKDLRKKIIVPGSIFTTKKLLVMDWLDGGSLRDSLRRDYMKLSKKPEGLRRNFGLFQLRRRGRRALETVAVAHGAMIFDLSAFTVDPHPGNIIDSSKKIGIIDFGNFKTFTASERLKVALLYKALDTKDKPAIVRAMQDMGFRSQKMDPDFVVAFATQCFDHNIVDTSPYQLLQDLEQQDRLLTIPSAYMLVCRVSLLVRGLARRLGYEHFSCANLWRNEVNNCLRQFQEDDKIIDNTASI